MPPNLSIRIAPLSRTYTMALSAMMCVPLWIGLIGPRLAARLLGERFGLLRPVVIGALLLAADAACMGTLGSLRMFVAATLLLTSLSAFLVPYTMSLLSRLDPYWAAAGPGFMMIGVALGPILGAPLVTRRNIPELGFLAACLVLTAILMFVTGGRIHRRPAYATECQPGPR